MSRTAIRRHKDKKILSRRLSRSYHVWARGNPRWEGIYRWTGTTCSCCMCRRNRRFEGPSPQEKRQVAWMELCH